MTPTIREIQDITARYYGISPAEIRGPGRYQPVARARQVAIKVSRDLTGFSYPLIGRGFKRDHTTIMHACSRVARNPFPGEVEDVLKIKRRVRKAMDSKDAYSDFTPIASHKFKL